LLRVLVVDLKLVGGGPVVVLEQVGGGFAKVLE